MDGISGIVTFSQPMAKGTQPLLIGKSISSHQTLEMIFHKILGSLYCQATIKILRESLTPQVMLPNIRQPLFSPMRTHVFKDIQPVWVDPHKALHILKHQIERLTSQRIAIITFRYYLLVFCCNFQPFAHQRQVSDLCLICQIPKIPFIFMFNPSLLFQVLMERLLALLCFLSTIVRDSTRKQEKHNFSFVSQE